VTTKPVGSSSKKGASRANLKPPSTKPRRKTPPPKADNSHHRHKKKRSGPGITSAIAKRSAKRYGSPEARLKLRLTMEETLGPTTPLRPDDNLIRLSEAAKRIGIATWTRFGVAIHPRSLTRALARRKKKQQ
jgi:hypothetical protein